MDLSQLQMWLNKHLLVKEIEYMKTNKKPMTAVAEVAYCTVYSALINDHLDNNRPTLPYS